MNIKENLLYGCALFILLGLYSFQVETDRKAETYYKLKIDSIQNENKKLDTKYQNLIDTIKTKNGFVAELYEIYKPIQKEAGILPSFLIGTAILESNNGKSTLTEQSNNLFCIKGSYNNKCVYSKDDEVGLSQFRKYDSYEESIKDYIKLMQSARYCEVINNCDYKSCATIVKQKGYASHPHYTAKLIEIIEKYELCLLDII